jgi:hypothetical protein
MWPISWTDYPGGSPATGVVVECDGRPVPATISPAGFVDGRAVVTVAGLSPATAYSLRCQCVVEDPSVDPDMLRSPAVAVHTLDLAGVEVRGFEVLLCLNLRRTCAIAKCAAVGQG